MTSKGFPQVLPIELRVDAMFVGATIPWRLATYVFALEQTDIFVVGEHNSNSSVDILRRVEEKGQ